jgi:beta-galactosidase
VVRRVGPDRSYRFLLNHGSEDVLLNARGLDLVTGEAASGTIRVPAGAVRVIREDAVS